MFRQVDDFIIDRLFQPAADRLARLASCYRIACFLLTGFGLLWCLYGVLTRHWALLVFLPLWLPHNYWQIEQADRAAASDAMPAIRLRHLPFRVFGLYVVFPTEILDVVVTPFGPNRLTLAWLLVVVAHFFAACRKLPPRRIEQSQAAWMELATLSKQEAA